MRLLFVFNLCCIVRQQKFSKLLPFHPDSFGSLHHYHESQSIYVCVDRPATEEENFRRKTKKEKERKIRDSFNAFHSFVRPFVHSLMYVHLLELRQNDLILEHFSQMCVSYSLYLYYTLRVSVCIVCSIFVYTLIYTNASARSLRQVKMV